MFTNNIYLSTLYFAVCISMVENMGTDPICFSACKADDHSKQSHSPKISCYLYKYIGQLLLCGESQLTLSCVVARQFERLLSSVGDYGGHCSRDLLSDSQVFFVAELRSHIQDSKFLFNTIEPVGFEN